MADGYWSRRQATPPMLSSGGVLKRPRHDYDAPPSGLHAAHEMHNYLARDDDRGGHLSLKDTKTIGSAYDRYLQSTQLSSFTSGEASTFGGMGRAVGGAMSARPVADPPLMGRSGSAALDLAPNGRNVGYSGQLLVDGMTRPGQDTIPLPPDASNTLYVEGLPPDSTKREVAHIFRPFVGYKEVRLVSKESRHRGGDPIILCFVDFSNPACAATAMSALQGYKMDEHDPDSNYLRLQFSRYPGPRSSSGARGRRVLRSGHFN
ncbi:RNA-binding protein 2-like isoform X2 [Herrania umbratica]|uniref:RNA-binding protein 2-like isoform X2 n=1 Tax=Herrania umbratica TaxID=108875 RepID=A0A6J1AF90_9ROSI|nr:RNA-binding protein 2-like isoform X2 [Herrania umbratica]